MTENNIDYNYITKEKALEMSYNACTLNTDAGLTVCPIYFNNDKILIPVYIPGNDLFLGGAPSVKYISLSREALTPVVEEIVKNLLEKSDLKHSVDDVGGTINA